MWKRILIVTVVVVCLFVVIAFVRFGKPGAVRVPSGGMGKEVKCSVDSFEQWPYSLISGILMKAK